MHVDSLVIKMLKSGKLLINSLIFAHRKSCNSIFSNTVCKPEMFSSFSFGLINEIGYGDLKSLYLIFNTSPYIILK